MTYTYLASPYSHPDPAIRQARFEAVCREAAALMREGVIVFSPIAHSHSCALAGSLPLQWEFWERYDRAMLENADDLVVLTMDGWRESKGIAAEIKIAQELGVWVSYREPQPGNDVEVPTT